MTVRVAVYPGTFDPITNGHLDIVARAARLFDRLVIGVAVSAGKAPMLALEDRLALVRIEAARLGAQGSGAIEAQPMRGLLVDFARTQGADVVVRGLRVGADFDNEQQMAGMNHCLAPELETVFLIAGAQHQFITSGLVRQIAVLGGDVASFVPEATLHRLAELHATPTS